MRHTKKCFEQQAYHSAPPEIRKYLHGDVWAVLGYTVEDFMTHIEAHFKEGMTWENRGLREGWQIHHIRPQWTFEWNSYADPGFKECWSLSNMRPLWVREHALQSQNWNGMSPLTLCKQRRWLRIEESLSDRRSNLPLEDKGIRIIKLHGQYIMWTDRNPT